MYRGSTSSDPRPTTSARLVSHSTWCLSSWAKNAKRAKSAWHARQRELVATACGSKPLATARHSPPRVEDCTTCSPPNPDCASAGGFRTEVADGWARASPPYLYIRTCVAIHIGSDDRCYVGQRLTQAARQ